MKKTPQDSQRSMKFESIVFLLFTFFITFGNSSIHSPDGDIIDCINREKQPAFQHSALTNHKIQEPPNSALPYKVRKKATNKIWQVWHRNGTRCPEGFIPIRRYQRGTQGSSAESRVTDGHEHATGYMNNHHKVYGTQATMSVWSPHTEGADEFSLAQVWLTSGDYENKNLNSIEAGWQVCPLIYNDSQPRFFVYWTTDAYNLTGGYNLRAAGFVQTSTSIVIEGAIDQKSVLGGVQAELTIRVWKDQKHGNWWLAVVLDGVLEPVGYWPAVLFTIQIDYATSAEWGGEIINTNPFGRHTKTEMGSGYGPDSGVRKVVYMRDLKVALSENNFQPFQDLETQGAHPDFYQAKVVNSTCFTYGGPHLIISSGSRASNGILFLLFVVIFSHFRNPYY